MIRIEEKLKELVFRNIAFIVDDKVIKQGKVNVFNTKQNFIKFKIEIDGNLKEWELSYPFTIRDVDDGYIFDYCLSAFCPRTEDAYWKMKLMDKSGASKMHNNYLHVVTLSA